MTVVRLHPRVYIHASDAFVPAPTLLTQGQRDGTDGHDAAEQSACIPRGGALVRYGGSDGSAGTGRRPRSGAGARGRRDTGSRRRRERSDRAGIDDG